MIQHLNNLHISGFSRVRYHLFAVHRRLFLILAACLALIAAAYLINIFRIGQKEEKIRKTGIEISKQLSRSVSLPLLEENIQSIQSLLSYAAKNKDILTLSVFDHRKEIVTQLGPGEVLPHAKDGGQSISQVSVWENELDNQKNVFSFSTDIVYAGTKIGELYMALPGAETSAIRNQLKIAVILVFLIVVAFVGAWRYPDISSRWMKFKSSGRQKTGVGNDIDPVMTGAFVTCPLCGTRKAFTPDVFRHSDLEDVFLFKVSEKEEDRGNFPDSEGIQLAELSEKEDLSWLKRQVIMRCGEIILKLTRE